MHYKKISIILLAILLTVNCGKTIIRLNSAAAPETPKADTSKAKKGAKEVPVEPVVMPVKTELNIDKPNYKKTYMTQFLGFREYSKPVTPNKPQTFKSTWFTTKAEMDKHVTPVCTNNVQAIVIYPDLWDSVIHFFLGGIVSTRSVLVYCN